MREAVTTMTQIDAQAKKIKEITSVIDSIAFKTNILALNAAVEAARAGEQVVVSRWWQWRCAAWQKVVAPRPGRSVS